MIDLVLHVAWILFIFLIVWWLEELGIFYVGFYSFFGIESLVDPSHRRQNKNKAKLVQTFTQYEYPLELEKSSGNDFVTWNGASKYSNIFAKLKFICGYPSTRIKQWMLLQKNCTSAYFHRLESTRSRFLDKIRLGSQFEVGLTPLKRGSFYFQYRKSNADTQSAFALYKSNSLEHKGEIVFDTGNAAELIKSEDANSFADSFVPTFVDCWISEDGALIACGVSMLQPDDAEAWMQIVIRNTISGKNLDDVISHVDISSNVVWAPRNAGFYYSATGSASAVRYHRLGTKQETDTLIFYKSFPEAHVTNKLQISCDGSKLLIHVFKSSELGDMPSCYSIASGNALFSVNVANRVNAAIPIECTEIVGNFDDRFEYICCTSDSIWLRTNKDAPLFKVVRCCLYLSETEVGAVESPKVDANSPVAATNIEFVANPTSETSSSSGNRVINRKILNFYAILRDCISEDRQGALLESAQIADLSLIVVKFVLHASQTIMLYRIPVSISGLDYDKHEAFPIAELPHSPFGTVAGPNCAFGSSEIIYKYSGFADPGSIFSAKVSVRHEANTFDESIAELTRQSIGINLNPPISTAVPGINLAEFETRQEFVTGADGVLMPIFLIASVETFESRNSDELTPHPCLLYAHGGFGVPVLPSFSLTLLLFMRHCGGIICVANFRGGGEYGSQWHRDGSGANKIRGADDIIKVAEYLIEGEFTTQKQLGLLGGGVGGILVGTAINRRPWLFAAAVIEDGLFDSINYKLFSPPLGAPFVPGQIHPHASDSVEGGQATKYSREFEAAIEVDDDDDDGAGSEEVARSKENKMEILSPVQSVVNRDIPYPAVMLMCASEESRESCPCLAVAPMQHSLEFAVVLQHAVGGRTDQKKPLLLYFVDEAKIEESRADLLSFLMTNLSASWRN